MTYKTIEEYRMQNPDVNFSAQDLVLAKQNSAFASDLMIAKDMAKDAGGDSEKISAANNIAEAARQKYGGYLGGSDGAQYIRFQNAEKSESPYAYLDHQLNGADVEMASANDTVISALRNKQTDLKYSAQKQIEGITSGYFQSLSGLEETLANNGYSPLGGQSRTLKADALSDTYQRQNDTENTLRSALSEVELAIGKLASEGKMKEAQQLYENAKLWASQNQQNIENEFQRQEWEYEKEQKEFQNKLSEAKLFGTYNGQDTLDKQKIAASASEFSQELAYKYAALAQKQTTAKRKEEAKKTVQTVFNESQSKNVTTLTEKATEAALKRKGELSKLNYSNEEKLYQEWLAALQYIDLNSQVVDGIAAIYQLDAPDEIIWRYLQEQYAGQNEEFLQAATAGQALYLEWKE